MVKKEYKIKKKSRIKLAAATYVQPKSHGVQPKLKSKSQINNCNSVLSRLVFVEIMFD